MRLVRIMAGIGLLGLVTAAAAQDLEDLDGENGDLLGDEEFEDDFDFDEEPEREPAPAPAPVEEEATQDDMSMDDSLEEAGEEEEEEIVLEAEYGLSEPTMLSLDSFDGCAVGGLATTDCGGTECVVAFGDSGSKNGTAYPFANDSLSAGKSWSMGKPIGKVGGVAIRGSEAAVVGTMGRTPACELAPNTQRYVLGTTGAAGLSPLTFKKYSTVTCNSVIDRGIRNDDVGGPVCEFMQYTQARADVLENKYLNGQISDVEAEKNCIKVNPFAVGAAVMVATARGLETWAGLVGPTYDAGAVAGTNELQTPILRVGDEGKFDAAALLHLEGRPVRGLAIDGDNVVVLAGQSTKANDSALYMFLAADLEGGAAIKPILLTDQLPGDLSGLTLAGDRYIVGQNGERASKKSCSEAPSLLAYPSVSAYNSGDFKAVVVEEPVADEAPVSEEGEAVDAEETAEDAAVDDEAAEEMEKEEEKEDAAPSMDLPTGDDLPEAE